jgi:hypothetical protein
VLLLSFAHLPLIPVEGTFEAQITISAADGLEDVVAPLDAARITVSFFRAPGELKR